MEREVLWPQLSEKERDRRYGNIRNEMRLRNLDCLLVVGTSGNYNSEGADVKYISNFDPYYGEVFVVFPREGEGLLTCWTPTGAYWAGKKSWIPVKYSPWPFVNDIAGKIQELGLEEGSIGIVGIERMPASIYNELTQRLPKARFEPASDWFSKLQLIKSDEELKFVEKAAELADYAYDAMVKTVKSGKKEYEVYAAIEHAIASHGGRVPSFILVCSGPTPLFPTVPPTHRALKVGDTFLDEISPSYGGYWVQFCRPIAIGKPRRELEKMFEVCYNAYKLAIEELRPGKTPLEVNNKVLDFIKTAGYDSLVAANVSEKGLHLTYSSDCAPVFWNLKIVPNMTFVNHIHVCTPDRSMGMLFGDMFVTTEGKPRSLNKSPRDYTVV